MGDVMRGLRDFKYIILDGAKVFAYNAERYKTFQEYMKKQNWKAKPLKIERSRFTELLAPGLHMPWVKAANANFVQAKLAGATLNNGDFQEASFYKADLRGADLREANFAKASLREADLRDADIRDAIFVGADLRGTKLDGAKRLGATFEGADFGDKPEVQEKTAPGKIAEVQEKTAPKKRKTA
jgi:uncharacterized protein YjbI with pentapeptide repeats